MVCGKTGQTLVLSGRSRGRNLQACGNEPDYTALCRIFAEPGYVGRRRKEYFDGLLKADYGHSLESEVRVRKMRMEKDFLGELSVPEDVYWGIHTQRALENFAVSGWKVHSQLIKALAQVKISAALANMELGFLNREKALAISEAGSEVAGGKLLDQFPVDALQGGAGTSTNMNMNEVLARRASQLLGRGEKSCPVDPLDEVNLHQSTNDVYPTALRIAAIQLLLPLSEAMASLQDALQQKEAEFADCIKPGRTQLQDAVPITLGQEFSAYAQAVSRDRWRLYKVEERLRQVNLGGTAVGTGLNAPREYIFLVVEKLRQITGIGLARAENMMDVTQNADVFVEVSGLLKAAAVTLSKMASDLRLLSSGPYCGLGEISLPGRQAGSSIMPGKVNPVIAEVVNQVSFQVIAQDLAITLACQNGQLELNAFLPLVAHNLLHALEMMTHSVLIFSRYCIRGIKANSERCRQLVEDSMVLAPALLPHLGYEKTTGMVKAAGERNMPLFEVVESMGYRIPPFHQLVRPGIAGGKISAKKEKGGDD